MDVSIIVVFYFCGLMRDVVRLQSYCEYNNDNNTTAVVVAGFNHQRFNNVDERSISSFISF